MPAIFNLSHRSCYPAHRSRSIPPVSALASEYTIASGCQQQPVASIDLPQLQGAGRTAYPGMELPDPGHDLVTETGTVEYAVMTDLLL